MSKPKYFLCGADGHIGTLWEMALGNVLVLNELKLNANGNIEIYEYQENGTPTKIDSIDLRELFMSILPR